MKPVPAFHAPDRAAWRKWLADNQASSVSIWLVYDKAHTDRECISY